MPTAGDIRAGRAYVELLVKDEAFKAGLSSAVSRLQAVGAAVGKVDLGAPGGEKGFLSGGFRGAEIFETGLKLTTAVAGLRVAMADVAMFSSLFRGDMEGALKAVGELPFGLGAVSKELGDLLARGIVWGIDWSRGITAEDLQMRGVPAETMKQWTMADKAIRQVQQSIDKLTLSTEDYARAEARRLGLKGGWAEAYVSKKMEEEAAAQGRKSADETAKAVERAQGRDRDAIQEATDALLKLDMTEEEYIVHLAARKGLTGQALRDEISLRMEVLRRTREQKAAEEGWADVMKGADRDVAAAAEAVDDLVRAGARQGEEASKLIEAAMTPKEKLAAQIAEWKDLQAEGWISPEVYQANLNQALMDAAAAMPETVARTTIGGGVRGTFSAVEAMMGPSEAPVERIARATEETAKHTRAIALAAELGVTFAP